MSGAGELIESSAANTDGEPGHDVPIESIIAQPVRIIRRRWLLALATFLIFSVSGAAAVRLRPLLYEASAKLLIERDNQRAAILEEEKPGAEPRTADDVEVQSQMLRRRNLIADAIVKGHLWESTDLGGKSPTPATAAAVDAGGLVDAFLSHLRIETPQSRSLLEVYFQSADPVLAMKAVNLLTEGYIEEQRATGFAASDETVSWLRSRLEEQRGRLAESEAALQQFLEQKDALSVEEHQNIVVQKLEDLSASVTRAKTDRIAKEALYRQLQSVRLSPGSLDQLPIVLGNAVLQQLRQQLAELTQKELTTAQDLGDRHPDLIKLRSEIELTRSRLNAELDKVLGGVRSDFVAAQSVEASLTAALEAQKEDVLSLNRKSVDYRALERQAVSDRELYQKLLAQTQSRGIVGQTPASQVSIVEPAALPRVPLGLPRRTALMLVLLGAALLSASAPLAAEALDPRMKTPADIVSKLRLRCLAMVPTSEHGLSDEDPLLSGDPTAFGESFRRIRTAVVADSRRTGTVRILVTSAVPREGKSLVAANLALALAETRERVLLIDGDMRRARIHQVFDLPREPGLAEILDGSCPVSEGLRSTRFPNLFVVSGGAPQRNTSHLLMESSLERLRTLQEPFRWIVIDSPPVGPVSDACMFAPQVDQAVFVIGADQATGGILRHAVDQLRKTGVKIVGAVLNKVDLKHSAFYYAPYYSTEYASYYQTKDAPSEP